VGCTGQLRIRNTETLKNDFFQQLVIKTWCGGIHDKQTYYSLQKDGIISAYIWRYYLLLNILIPTHLIVKGKHKEFQREFRNWPIKKKKESFDYCKLVSSVIGGWAPCAPSPTTRVAGHDVAAA
jgi:hypothetical protein